MENNLALPFLPPQTVGEQTETSAVVQANDETAARLIFEQACERLNNINNWKKLCGVLSADFELMDEHGNPVKSKVAKGNYIRINILGPGTKAGDGYDWVRIENIHYEIIALNKALYLIQARPAKMPGSDNNNIAHFLTDKATSSFVLTLDGEIITATVFGRNEIPNTEIDNTLDKIRNAVIGSTGAIGLSKLQWKALVDGILNYE